MLLELKVTHFAVIDSLEVHFLRPGLNVLTGETGAGKSILLKSLALLLGGKASPDMIRAGHEQALIEGAFDLGHRPDIKETLKELALDSGDDGLVIRRLISQSGKHRLYINGHLSTLNVLEKIVPSLVEITGQHEHHSLTKPAAQLDLLDEFAGLNAKRAAFLDLYHLTHKTSREIEELQAAARDREQRLDFLRFQVQEIHAFNPQVGEDAQLTSQFQKTRFASKLSTYAKKSENVLYSDDRSVNSILSELVQEGETLLQIDSSLKPAVQSMKEAVILLEDAAFNMRDYSKSESVDPAEVEQIEDRMSNLKKLQKKYGATAEEILVFCKKAEDEISSLERHDENIKELHEKLKTTQDQMKSLALEIREKRKKAAKKLCDGINVEIRELNMKGTEFSLAVKPLEELQSTGGDEVTFLIKSSPKDEPKPIAKIASGGELSRLMLAIKQVVAEKEHRMTFLFDEVDSGVSGPTAERVGRKLKTLGSYHQVICITHLPQVAAYADAHFLITKEVSGGLVKSQVSELKPKERVQELGRMISGKKVTEASLRHAKEMLEMR